MGRTKIKAALAAMAIVLAIFLLTTGGIRRLKLSAGKGVPAISLAERHGLIPASDGSLWTWTGRTTILPSYGIEDFRIT